MNVLSCFDGISAGRLALQRAGIEVNTYYRSEVDKYADKVAMHHFPNDVQLGDVTKWREWDIDWSGIDMLIGGSPCQGFSFAGKQAGTKAVINGEDILVTDRETYLDMKQKGAEFLSQSYLFWEYVLILDHIRAHNPNVKFLLENVKMKKELLEMIDTAMGVKSVVINSSLLSAQNRVRHYWANWEITQPEDKGILLRDILEDGLTYGYAGCHKSVKVCNVNPSGNGMNGNVYHVDAKCPTLTTNKGEGIKITGGAIRGRYLVDGKRQDHKMKTAGLTEQRLEVREDGKTNCLTTVQKDNVVVFRPCELTGNKPSLDGLHHIADATDINGHDILKRVYSEDGKAPTMNACTGGNREPKVLVSDSMYPKEAIENKKNEASFIEHSGMNETAMKSGKTYCLTANCGGAWAKHSATKKVRTMAAVGFTQDTDVMTSHNQIKYRKLTPVECERLQTFPDNYTSMVSNSQRYRSLGNSWTVDVIAHIFKCM